MSVDIDLPIKARCVALARISEALARIEAGIKLAWPETRSTLVGQGEAPTLTCGFKFAPGGADQEPGAVQPG